MKKFLRKRWHSIPLVLVAVLLALALTTGGVLAAYSFYSGTVAVTVNEPMTVEPSEEEVTVSLGPGESVELIWTITNSGSAQLFVEASVSPDSRDGGNITTQLFVGGVGGAWALGPTVTDPHGIRANGGTLSYKLVITASGSTTPGSYTFTITFDRS